jgi:multidrug resistance efflux pump
VPVEPNTPLRANDVLFRIDPVPFQAQVDTLEAQLKFAELRLGQMSDLASKQAGRVFDVEQRDAEVKQLRAQLAGAKWNLEKTVVRAPSDGFVTNVALRKGARVASLPLSPAMAFIETSETIVGVQIAQINVRHVEAGQPVEITFKYLPGRIFPGQVETVLQAVSGGQTQVSGQAVTPIDVQSAPFVVRIRLEDVDLLKRLPAGSTGEAAIFTDHVNVAHVVRKVMLRMTAILNFVNPY